MSSLSDIPVVMEPSLGSTTEATGNLASLLSEIHQALATYLHAGTPKTIDLQAMPFAPGEEAELLQFLGAGEVSAEIRALGSSRIWETRFAGIWLVEHSNPLGERMALQVEITDIPELLRSQSEDMEESLEDLDRQLNSLRNTEEQP